MTDIDRFDPEHPLRLAPTAARYLRARDLARYEPSPLRDPQLDAFVLLDVYGRILDIAPAVAEQLGFGRERLLGRRFVHRLGAAWRSPFRLSLSLVRNEVESAPLVCDLRTRMNERRPVTLAFARARSESGQTLIIVDVAGLIPKASAAP